MLDVEDEISRYRKVYKNFSEKQYYKREISKANN